MTPVNESELRVAARSCRAEIIAAQRRAPDCCRLIYNGAMK